MLLIGLWVRYDAAQHRGLAGFVSQDLRRALTRSVSIAKRRTQRGLLLAALICLFVALAGPLLGFRWEKISSRGNEIVFAIDTSRSMLTPDVRPNRLIRAKFAIDDMARRLDGDAMGIVAFAGNAFLVCPITLDYGAFRESLGAIDTATVPRGGTNIARAIEAARQVFRRRPGTDKTLILVTDGEELEGSALLAAQTAANDKGLKIFTLGVGTAAGDLIPIPASQGGGFVKDDTGAFVRSRLDEAALKAIAAATGGFYVPLATREDGSESVVNAIRSLAKHDLSFRQQKIYTPRYQWPLGASLAMLSASLLVGSRRWRISPRPAAAGAVALSSLVLFVVLPTDPTRSADQAPATPSATAQNPIVDFNTGTAAYRAGQLSRAEQAFQQSIALAPSSDSQRLADQQDAYYDLGNTLYRAGEKSRQSAPQDTLKKWTEAVKAYETALQLRPDDADSKYNRDLVKRKIDELERNQNQDQNQDQNQGQNQGRGRQPPQGQSNVPPQHGPSGQPPKPDPKSPGGAGQPPPSAGGNPDQGVGDGGRTADDERPPGQMSREEARELLDSAKDDERQAMGAPLSTRDPDIPPDKPFKNW
jgi:Ca-activated chloride channel family protein